MRHSGICWRGWLICEWYLLTWISMWHVHDWEPYDMCLAKCHMLYCVNNAWMSCVWTSWNVWSGYWRDDIFMIGWVRYRNVHIELHSVYSWHTHMCYETMHSFPRINSYHSCKWDCNDFIIYLLLNKSWKRELFTYLKMSLNMWLKGRARMMAACVITLNNCTGMGRPTCLCDKSRT